MSQGVPRRVKEIQGGSRRVNESRGVKEIQRVEESQQESWRVK